MAQRSNVPEWGKWDGEEQVPYTVFFDKARKNRDGLKNAINPNDREGNPDIRNGGPPSRAAPRAAGGSPNDRRRRMEDGSGPRGSPSHHDFVGDRKRATRSLFHPPADSPSREAKAGLYGSGSGTRGGSRMKPATRADGPPSRGAQVPPFNSWNPADPRSGEDFTDMFDKVRKEKKEEAGKLPKVSTPSYADIKKQDHDENPKCGCIPW